MKNLLIRKESDRDVDDIERVVAAAFEHHPHSNQVEHILVRKLRDARAQRQGIGSALIQTGLAELRELGAGGCVLVGEPDYYHRFGFAASDEITMEGVPPEFFLVLPFSEEATTGTVAHHHVFDEFI